MRLLKRLGKERFRGFGSVRHALDFRLQFPQFLALFAEFFAEGGFLKLAGAFFLGVQSLSQFLFLLCQLLGPLLQIAGRLTRLTGELLAQSVAPFAQLLRGARRRRTGLVHRTPFGSGGRRLGRLAGRIQLGSLSRQRFPLGSSLLLGGFQFLRERLLLVCEPLEFASCRLLFLFIPRPAKGRVQLPHPLRNLLLPPG